MLTTTCCPATSCSFGIHVHCISTTQLLFIYLTIDLYPFVSSNRRATNWQQFCWRQQATCWQQHVFVSGTRKFDRSLLHFTSRANCIPTCTGLTFRSESSTNSDWQWTGVCNTTVPSTRWTDAQSSLMLPVVDTCVLLSRVYTRTHVAGYKLYPLVSTCRRQIWYMNRSWQVPSHVSTCITRMHGSALRCVRSD